MRVLFLEQQSSGGEIWDGVGSYTVTMSKALASEGHEVHHLSCRSAQRKRDVEENGVIVHYRPELHLRGLGLLLRLPLLRAVHDRWRGRDAEIVRDIRLSASNYVAFRRLGIDVDVIEASTYPRQSLAFALVRSRPLVLTRHGISWQESIRAFDIPPDVGGYADEHVQIAFFERCSDALSAFEKRGTQVVTVASRLLAETRARLDGTRRDVRIVPPAVELEAERWFAVPSVADSPPTALVIGTLDPRKGCDLAIEAAAKLAADFEGFELVFVGSPTIGLRDGLPYDDWLKQLATELGAPCRFVGHVQRDSLPELYARARMLVIPSWFDNYPMVGLEAMAAGRPIVSTTNVGYADSITEFGAGTVVPAGDVDALAEAMRNYLTDTDAAAAAGAQGRRLVESELSVEQVVAQRIDAYSEAIRRKRQARRRR
jgi:glycosyltransferase involved in cell wall biosynthesis